MTSLFHGGGHWRGAGDLRRWALIKLMTKLIFTRFLSLLFFAPMTLIGEAVEPIGTVSRDTLIKGIDSMVRDTVGAARINVTHDVAQKRLRVLSHVAGEKTVRLKEYGYQVEIIHNSSQMQVGVSSYRFQYGAGVLEFAATQYASGKKAVAIWLVGILAKEEPDLFWSRPDQLLTIQQIETAMKADDNKALKPFLEDEAQEWAGDLKTYGP
jgi:hypothetical protein